jgi:outer membrane protein OmpA-like peptidoglycan-associated protein
MTIYLQKNIQMKKNILFILSLISAIYVDAQVKTSSEKKGDQYYFVYSYQKAIEAYVGSSVLTIDGQRKLAKSYHKTGSNNLAENTYEKILSSKSGIEAEDYFEYAMLLKNSGKYSESNRQMEVFREQKPNDLRVLDYVANKDKLKEIMTDKGTMNIQNLAINTEAQDIGLSFYLNKIVFASSRSTIINPKKSNINNLPYLKLYSSEVKDGIMLEPEEFDITLNGSLNDGPASFNKEGTYMAYTQNNYDLNKKERIVKLQLNFKTLKNGKWSASEPFMLNNKNYSLGHANLSSYGNTMYFASDMPGGYGGSDIYRVVKNENNQWSKAENLGITINTEGDELYPFFEEKSGSFFYTSNGKFGLGGFDIFVSNTYLKGFQNSVNAGAPLNTMYDDFGLIVDDNLNKYYFSSNRAGGKGNDDIYTMENFLKITKPETLDTPKIEIKIATAENLKVNENISRVLNFKNVFFDVDKSNIRPDAIHTLDNIVYIMNNYPMMALEIRAHTDCRENQVYNQLLSNRRAISCLNFIKKRITNPKRISGKGYGKSLLINNCNCQLNHECSEEDHQENRRVEFIVVRK